LVARYEDLIVYQRSYAIALDIHKFSLTLPDTEKFGLASQMQRSSKSICANIAEGFAKQHKSKPEFKRFLLMAVGSSEEMRVWLNFCKDLEYLSKKNFDLWHKEYDEISKMLNGLINKWR